MTHTHATSSEKNAETYGLTPEDIQALCVALNAQDNAQIRVLTASLHTSDIAEFINQAKTEERQALIYAIRATFDPEILLYLDAEIKDDVIDFLGAEESAAAIAQLHSDDAVQVMEDLNEEEQQEILEAIPDEQQEQRETLEQGLAHPEDAAGRLMDSQFVTIDQSWNVGQTIDFLRKNSDLPSDFYTIFVIDDKHIPVGNVLVSRVLRSKREVAIKDIMEAEVKTIAVETDQEEVAYIFRKYALASAPVVDQNGAIIGVISVDDIVDVLQEEAQEDIMRLGGVSQTDLFSDLWKTTKKRFPWLFINLLTAIAASAVIAAFEDAIQQIVALAVLMPIVASMAGNAGTQTLTIAVRGIATKELTTNNARRVVAKEIAASFINGLAFAILVATVSYLYYHDAYLSLVFAASTIVALAIAGLAGAVIPLLLTRFGVDPAIASGVFLTTVTDVAAFFIFLGLAAWLLI